MVSRKKTVISFIILFSIVLTSCSSYQSMECPYQLKQITMCDSQTGWAITAKNEILFTKSGIENFEIVKNAPDIDTYTDGFLNANFIDEDTAYITYFSSGGENLVVEYSEDGGKKWEHTYVEYKNYAEVSDAGSTYISIAEDGMGYLLYCSTPGAGMMTKLLFYTEDAGASFTFVENLTEVMKGYPQGISFTNGEIGYIATSYHGEDDYLYQTRDKGKTWKSTKVFAKEKDVSYLEAYPPVFSIHNMQEGMLIIKEVKETGITYKLFLTTDGGNNWTAKGKIPEDSILDYSFVTENEMYVIDDLGQLFEMHK